MRPCALLLLVAFCLRCWQNPPRGATGAAAAPYRHLVVLHCPVLLMLNDTSHDVSPYVALQNIPFILYHHLNHEDNRPLLPHLLPRLAGSSPSGGSFADCTADASTSGSGGASPALRLLRVLCAAFFRPEWYTGRSRISSAAGAYSTVYRASLPAWAGDGTVVLKLVDTPRHIQDRCAQVGLLAGPWLAGSAARHAVARCLPAAAWIQ